MASSSGSSGTVNDTKDSRWYFTAEQLGNSPSRKHGIDADQELSFRQLTAYLIQEMGQRLQVSQLCINTAIVYMHRFYTFHSFTHFHRNGIAAAALFLAAKVQEQPRKLEHVIKVAHICLNPEAPQPSADAYAEQAQDLVFNENVLLQTLGFDVVIDHPHTHVVKTCHLVKACKDLAQTSYFLASNSLHLTSMCLQYRPTVVACFCIYLACKWSRWEIPQSTEGKHWFHYVDKSVTMDLLKQLTDEFIAIYEKSPARLKSKVNSIKAIAQGARIPEPSRNVTESSNGSQSSQMSQSDQSRRPENYASHHRSHHSSSHPNHHHSSKQASNSAEIGEHKSSHKQSYSVPPGGTYPSRSRGEREQLPMEGQYNVPAVHSSSKQLPIQMNSSRGTSSNRLPSHMIPPLSSSGVGSGSSQRSSHQHEFSYHKNRKMISSQQINPTSGLDMSRNALPSQQNLPSMQQQRSSSSSSSYIIPNSSSQPSIYPIQTTQNRSSNSNSSSSSNSSNINNSNIKYEQSVQQQNYLQNSQKQSAESSYNSTTNTRQATVDEGIKMSISSADQMDICSPPRYSSYSLAPPQSLSSTQNLSQQLNMPSVPSHSQHQTQQQQKPLSIFSPEWNEKPFALNAPLLNNTSSNNSNINKPLGLTMKAMKDSPKKLEREKKSEILRKEKPRHDLSHNIDLVKVTGHSSEKRFTGTMSGTVTPQLSSITTGTKKTSEVPATTQNQTFAVPSLPYEKISQPHVLNLSSVKRQSSDLVSKLDEDTYRENKVRKLETQSPSRTQTVMQQLSGNQFPQQQQVLSKGYSHFSYEQQQHLPPNDLKVNKTFSNTVNGIETNPNLVSSLLKESLCNESKFNPTPFMKNELREPEDLSLIDQPPIMETVPEQILQMDGPVKEEIAPTVPPAVAASNNNIVSIASNVILPMQEDTVKSKSEKKKKKDKHKHKEKDKSKDKEERKKHKKDKEKHKEKERHSSSSNASVSNEHHQNPVKIKIPKDKLNLSSLELSNNPPSLATPSSGFKIKIPKDRIKGSTQLEDNSLTSGHNSSSAVNQTLMPSPSTKALQQQPSSIKIKISKDKIENYSHHHHHSSSSLPTGLLSGSGNGSIPFSGFSSNNSGGSSNQQHGHYGSGNNSGITKKKDREKDRDRERDKKRVTDYNKQNGSGGSGLGGSNEFNSNSSSATSSRNQSNQSMKLQKFDSNQLFGESNDEDESSSSSGEDEDTECYPNEKKMSSVSY